LCTLTKFIQTSTNTTATITVGGESSQKGVTLNPILYSATGEEVDDVTRLAHLWLLVVRDFMVSECVTCLYVSGATRSNVCMMYTANCLVSCTLMHQIHTGRATWLTLCSQSLNPVVDPV